MSLLYSIKAIIFLDAKGNRLLAKYFTNEWPTKAQQTAFEQILFSKTFPSNDEIILLDGTVGVYKISADLGVYLLAGPEENEIFLLEILGAFLDALSRALPRSDLDARVVLENLDTVLLALDTLIDEGIVMETDAQEIFNSLASLKPPPTLEAQGIPVSQDTIESAKKTAASFLRSFLS